METILLVIHLIASVSIVGIVLIQLSEGGCLGIGSSNSMGGLMSARGTANFLTRATVVLGVVLMISTLGMAILHKSKEKPASVIDKIVEQSKDQPTNAPSENVPKVDAKPAVPLAD